MGIERGRIKSYLVICEAGLSGLKSTLQRRYRKFLLDDNERCHNGTQQHLLLCQLSLSTDLKPENLNSSLGLHSLAL